MKPHPTLHPFTAGILALAVSSLTSLAALELFVAPTGDDANPGTAAKPFATLTRAQDAVRTHTATGLKDDVLVTVHAGTYRLATPLVFGASDGGTAKHSVIWAARPGEKVIISGGRPIGNWKRGENGLWTAEIPKVKVGDWFFRQLYADGRRQLRGRFPQEGFLKITGISKDQKTLQITPALPETDLTGRDTEVVVVQNWSISRERVASHTSNALTAETQIGWVGHGQCIPRKGMAIFLEHSPAFVKTPGQWDLDRKSGQLTYMAKDREDPNKRNFIAPVLDQLLLIEGTSDQPVLNLEFRGLTFAHSSFEIPKIGYAGIQACYHGTTQAEGKTFATPVAVELINATGCRISDCRLQHLGGSGIGLGAGCRDNLITGCEISDVGATGVNVGHMRVKNPLWADWSDKGEVPTNNEVSNCYIHHCGEDLWGGHGIFDGMTSGTRIRHNEISHLPYGGIATGYVWNTERTSQQNCLIEFNHIHEVMLKLNDSGCLYTLGYQPGSIIRGNLMHGVRIGGFAAGAVCNNGIFMDEGSKGFLIEDNVIYDVDQRPGARNSPVRHNRSQHDWQTWQNNSIGFEDAPPAAAKELAKKAGLEPKFRKLLKSK